VVNDVYDTTNNIYSLWLARDYLAAEDSLLLESDLIFEPSIIKELVEDNSPNLAVVSRFESWMDGTVTMLDDEGIIVSVVDKAHFKWKRVGDYYKTVNIYKFSKDFSSRYYLPFLDAYLKSFGHNEYYEQVLKVLAFLEDSDLKGYKVKGRRWYEIDDPQDLAVAETLFCEDCGKLDRMQARYGGYWRFPAMIDYCYLVNPYFPTKRLRKEMKSSFKELLSHYPSGAAVQSQLAAKAFGVGAKQAVVGNGAAELIALTLQGLSGTVGVPLPTFGEYSARVPPERLKTFVSGRADCSYSASELKAFAAAVDTLVIINPDNPSGHFLDKEELLPLIDELLRGGKRVIVDESFADFADPARRFTLLDEEYLAERPGLYVIKSISKSYGVPGCRLGVLATGDTAEAARIRKALPVWNINSFGEFFMQIMDKYKADYKSGCELLAEERGRFAAGLASLGCMAVYPSQANYLLAKLSGGLRARALAERLLAERRILIKDLTGKEGLPAGEYIRLAVRDQKDNDKLLDALKDCM
jgi:histidinol-phosphate/aromatic aminotransferase/cobyric acid decarboxylase-like protein/choline kinase